MFKKPSTTFFISLLILLTGSSAFAASHREAPLIAMDPVADITDFYAFRSWEDPEKAVLIMNVIPTQEPSAGPNYFNFGDEVLYEIYIDNNQNNIARDITYQFRFKTEIRSPGNVFPLSYVALPPITSLDGPGSEGLLLRQSYTVTEIRHGHHPEELGQGLMVAVPSNIGPRTTPDYDGLSAQGIYPLKNGGRVFAGQRDETFYIDLGATFDTLNFPMSPILSTPDDADDTLNIGEARDSFSGFNINTIAIEIPIEDLLGDDGNRVIGAYAATSRPKVSVIRKDNKRAFSKHSVQVARMGNPLVNELVIATSEKDRWNATFAERERRFLNFYCESSLATAMNVVFGTGFPTQDREDLVNVLLRYTLGSEVCGSNSDEEGDHYSDDAEKERFADFLRLDLDVEPTAPEDQKRLGILAHDSAGSSTPDPAAWPNGRRPNDDVTDIALRVVAGALIDPATPRLGDGVNFNIGAGGSDLTANGISTQFPFLPTPHDGRDRRHIDPGETP